MPTRHLHLPRKYALLASILALTTFLTLTFPLSGLTGILSNLKSHNIITLIGHLSGTTKSMLRNTEILHGKVQHVKSELGQLATQEASLRQQLATGKQLSLGLTNQEHLTQTDVQLMQQILNRQQQSVQLTAQVASQAKQISSGVTQNVQQLSQLSESLNTAGSESDKLNRQMDSLLSELDQSTQEFRFFGQVDRLLSGLGGLLGIAP